MLQGSEHPLLQPSDPHQELESGPFLRELGDLTGQASTPGQPSVWTWPEVAPRSRILQGLWCVPVALIPSFPPSPLPEPHQANLATGGTGQGLGEWSPKDSNFATFSPGLSGLLSYGFPQCLFCYNLTCWHIFF